MSALAPNVPLASTAVLLKHFHDKGRSGIYFYGPCDGFTEFAFNMCIERDESPASIVKAVYLFTENKDFVRTMDQGFTFVFNRWEELTESIGTVVKPVNGKIMFSKNFHEKISAPLVSRFGQFVSKGSKR